MRTWLCLTSAAYNDVAEATDWYEDQRTDLGGEFLDELDHVLARVADEPLQFPQIEQDIRRALLRRFPFAVYFVNKPGRIDVIAVLHQHREPGEWKRRS